VLVRVAAGARQNIAAAFEFDQPILGFEFGAGQEIGQVRNPQLHRRDLRQAQVLASSADLTTLSPRESRSRSAPAEEPLKSRSSSDRGRAI